MMGWISAILVVTAAQSGGGPDRPGVVSHVKVLSDRVPDVSSLEAWKRTTLKEGMSDREKALAAWKTVVTFQHQDSPPAEHLQASVQVQDAIKVFNVYGYAMCSNASAHIAQLSRYAGLETRGWAIHGHSVPEVRWDGAWHLLDASLINYFPKADGKIASVGEITAAITEWYKKNPGYKGSDKKLREFHRANGWSGWKRGPELLTRSPQISNGGWWPAGTHGWYSTMMEYDGTSGRNSKSFLYEYGYSQGYRVNIQLREGERLTRNWSHKGLHVNMKDRGAPGCLKMKTGKGFLKYTPAFGDLAPGRVGNGIHEYEVPLARGAFRKGALVARNLTDDARVRDASKPGVLVVRMPSSYVYLTGALAFTPEVAAGGSVAVAYSDNHGIDWKELARATSSGPQKVDLSPHVFRRYDYRLRFELAGKGTGLSAVRIRHDIQHSQRALPALGKGKNTITFRAGAPEGTITLEGATNPREASRQLTFKSFHPRVESLREKNLLVENGRGSITFPVSTPGDLVRIRFGTHYRARDKRDGWDYEVSFDEGKSWKKAGRAKGPTPGHCTYVTFTDVPPGKRRALVRFSGTSRNTTLIHDFRIDADYVEPSGGFLPVRVTYRWEEGGAAKERVLVARKPSETWTIDCGAKPVMKSITLEPVE